MTRTTLVLLLKVFVNAEASDRAVQGVGLQPLACGFEHPWGN